MSDIAIRAVLILFGLACVGTEVFGTYEFLWEKYGHWNYLVVGGLIVTSLAAVLPMAAEYARRNRQVGLTLVCWLAVPLTLVFVFTAAIQRTGAVVDLDEAGRKTLAQAIATARKAEAEAQLATDKAIVNGNCGVWGPICQKAKDAQAATEAKLSAARAVLMKNATVVDDSMARRIVAYVPWITKEQVQLYHPMLLPLALAILGSICVAIGMRGKPEPKEQMQVQGMWSRIWRRNRQVEADVSEKAENVDTSKMDAKPAKLPAPPRPKLVAANPKPPAGSVPKILTALLAPSKGARVEMGEVYAGYAAECRKQGVRALALAEFADALAAFCKGAGIRTKMDGEHVYLLNVRLSAAPAEHGHAMREAGLASINRGV
jgi:hypothetical protein